MPLYIAMFDTEEEAIKAVATNLPAGWRIEKVLGKLIETVAVCRDLQPRSVTLF